MFTPGPDHPAFFEHAYLASYLGVPLVQGGDLIVRDAKVWLKSVDGLRQVDVIMRRVDDNLCDPHWSYAAIHCLGYPDCLKRCARGQVAVVNPIGSRAVENPALMAFLPAICQHWRSEESYNCRPWRPGGAANPTNAITCSTISTSWCLRPIHPMPGLPRSVPGKLTRQGTATVAAPDSCATATVYRPAAD